MTRRLRHAAFPRVHLPYRLRNGTDLAKENLGQNVDIDDIDIDNFLDPLTYTTTQDAHKHKRQKTRSYDPEDIVEELIDATKFSPP